MFIILCFIVLCLVLGFSIGYALGKTKRLPQDELMKQALELLRSANESWGTDPGRALAMKESADQIIALRSKQLLQLPSGK